MRKQQLAPGFIQQFQETCNKCGGEGRIIKKKCHVCKAQKTVKSVDLLTIIIEKGVADDFVYEFEEAGDEYINVRASTVKAKVEVLPHDIFERQGNDLKTEVKLTLKEALLGFKGTIPHLDGHKVKLNRLGVTNPMSVQKIQGEGMPKHLYSSEFGDLYVKYTVEFPEKLTEEQKTAIANLFS